MWLQSNGFIERTGDWIEVTRKAAREFMVVETVYLMPALLLVLGALFVANYITVTYGVLLLSAEANLDVGVPLIGFAAAMKFTMKPLVPNVPREVGTHAAAGVRSKAFSQKWRVSPKQGAKRAYTPAILAPTQGEGVGGSPGDFSSQPPGALFSRAKEPSSTG